ncbi:MAG: serine hydrolase [Acidobacteriota bacterium]|nr:serine hydrolase [Acidobacteriota bacterium]
MARRSSLLWLILTLSVAGSSFGAPALPVTGLAVPGMESYDQIIPDLMARWNIPGASVAVVRDGHLVFARGYGYADRDQGVAVQPDSLFRIISMSKPITSTANLLLMDQGKLTLDDKAFGILNQFQPPAGKTPDPRLKTITIRNLLQHSAGWDYSTDPVDPSDDFVRIANAVGSLPPATCEDEIRYMMGRPLDFTPGSKFVYYNFDYCVLGRIVEKITGQNYEEFVRANVLARMGVHAMRIGRSLPENRFSGEVKYYDFPDSPKVAYAFPGLTGTTPYPDGGFPLEYWDSYGGWVASAIDMTRFITSFDGRRGITFLSPAARKAIEARPDIPGWADSSYWYGLGWQIAPQRIGATWTANGTQNGSYGYMLRANDGMAWVVLFNSLPSDDGTFSKEVGSEMQRAFDGVTSWPQTDQYPQWPSVDPGASPHLGPLGLVNAASFTPGVAPGALVSIQGAGLASQSISASSMPLPPVLGNVQVAVNRQNAPLLYISPSQLNFQLPFETPPGAATLVITADGRASAPQPFLVNAAAPGIFQFGINRAVVQNADGSLNAANNPAPAGGTVVAYLTGQGQVDTSVVTGSAPASGALARPKLPVTASIGGQPADVLFGGLAPGFVGLMQLNLRVPGIAPGDYPLAVTIGGKQSNAPVLTVK